MDGPYLEEVEGRGGDDFCPLLFMNANNLNNTFIFSTKTRSFLTRKKKYQILLATYQQPLQFAMFLVQHLKTTFAK